jgi:hypothetical protein
MGNQEPEPVEDAAPDEFTVEISSLDAPAEDQPAPLIQRPLNTRLSPRARAWRVITVGCAFLALAVVLASVPMLRAQAIRLLAGSSSSPTQPTAMHFAVPKSATWQENWALLEARPLQLPALTPGAPCPTTRGRWVNLELGIAIGDGPVYVVYNGGSSADGILQYGDASALGDAKSAWGGQSVLWVVRPDAAGPVLVRSQQIDGPNQAFFNGGEQQQSVLGSWASAPLLSELRLLPSRDLVSWVYWGTFLRLRSPGCYAFQVDGFGFSFIVIFQAVSEAER